MIYNGMYGGNTQQAAPQIRDGGFIPVPSEDMARNYPVAQGTSVTFRDENAPYIYTKTMGFSPLDRPIFEKYKLIKEEAPKNCQCSGEVDSLRAEINKLWGEITRIKEGSHDFKHTESIPADEIKPAETIINEV